MANIELPKDAEGREIPLDTSEMFIADGTMVHVVKFEYMYYTCDARGSWFVHFNRTSGEHMTLQPCNVYLTPPDSWKKLEEDLSGISKGTVCHYFHKGDSKTCEGCPARTGSCWHTIARDIASRIRKLRCDD